LRECSRFCVLIMLGSVVGRAQAYAHPCHAHRKSTSSVTSMSTVLAFKTRQLSSPPVEHEKVLPARQLAHLVRRSCEHLSRTIQKTSGQRVFKASLEQRRSHRLRSSPARQILFGGWSTNRRQAGAMPPIKVSRLASQAGTDGCTEIRTQRKPFMIAPDIPVSTMRTNAGRLDFCHACNRVSGTAGTRGAIL